jgi:hypothetical protein
MLGAGRVMMNEIGEAIKQRKVLVIVGLVACLALVAGLVFAATSCQNSGVSGPGGCTMNAELMTDVTVPDGTQFAGGEAFTKTWRIKNSGTCNWEEGTQLAYVSGDPLEGPAAVTVSALTAGSSTDVSVDFVAPTAAGTYRSNWRMQMSGGVQFGAELHVEIVVPAPSSGAPSPTPTPTPVPMPTATLAPMPTPTPTPFGGGIGRIAYVSFRDGNAEIYTMGTSDASPTRLTNTPETEDKPDWSRDGGHIAFERWLSGKPDIFTMNADGSGQVNLTSSSSWSDYEPSWSPDGSHIAFSSNRAGGALQIWTMKSDGSALVRLTFTTKANMYPDWSPDGSRIVFLSQRDGQDEIYVMNANGTGQTRLTSTGGNGFPKWSPDGSKITFHGAHGIWVMNAYGGSKTQLTTNSTDLRTAWSPNGDLIAFDSTRSGNFDLWVMKPDGTGIAQLTTNSKLDLYPSWA